MNIEITRQEVLNTLDLLCSEEIDQMEMISEKVKNLRKVAGWCEPYLPTALKKVLLNAADTIESLSAKPQASNMERSERYYSGGWIPCSERLPEIEHDVLLSLRSLDICVGFMANTVGCFYTKEDGYVLLNNVLAWRELPEPYHEP